MIVAVLPRVSVAVTVKVYTPAVEGIEVALDPEPMTALVGVLDEDSVAVKVATPDSSDAEKSYVPAFIGIHLRVRN